MKIAVCLSGQPRTVKWCIEAIHNFYGASADYFCHAWNYNDYKVKIDPDKPMQWVKEPADLDEFHTAISILNPKAVVVEGVEALGKPRFPWDSMLYSAMMSNHLKSVHENTVGFRYDLVIKTRYDVAYPAGVFTPSERMKHGYTYHPQFDLFTLHCEHMAIEHDHINISDVTYYGSSWAMDAAADLYWYAKARFKNCGLDDMQNIGPGTLMAEYVCTNNIRFSADPSVKEFIYRKSAVPLDPLVDYNKICDLNSQIYK